jgi:hypothetical protein
MMTALLVWTFVLDLPGHFNRSGGGAGVGLAGMRERLHEWEGA